METVISALEAMKKATSIEIAARTGLSKREVINQLWDLKRRGLVAQQGMTWSPAELGEVTEQQQTAPLVAKISEDMIINALRDHGPQTTEQLAKRLSTTIRKVASTLAMPISKGRIKRLNNRGMFRFSLPDVSTEPTEKAVSGSESNYVGEGGNGHKNAAAVEIPQQDLISDAHQGVEKPVSVVLGEIPTFVSRPDDLIIPTVRGVNRELRRARAKVIQLEKLRDAVRELGKHKRLIREVLL